MEEGKRSRRKHKSRHNKESTEDYVEKEMARAMKQIEKAKKQARQAQEVGEWASRAANDVPEGVHYTADPTGEGIKVVYQKSNHQGTVIHMNNVENVQVGCHNNVVINKARKSRSSQDACFNDDDLADRRTDKKNEERNEAERMKILQALTDSTREVVIEDIETTCQFVGKNWRRLLRQLNLDDDEIEQIEQDYRGEGLRSVIYQAILTWSQRTRPQATIGVLAKALSKTEHYDAIRNLKP